MCVLFIPLSLFNAVTAAAWTQLISHVQPPPALSLCGQRVVHQSPISILLARTSWAVWVQRPEAGEHVPGFGLNAVLIIELSSDPWCHFPHIISAGGQTELPLSLLLSPSLAHTQGPGPLICICWRHAIDPPISTPYYLMKSSLREDSGCNFAGVQEEVGHRHFGRFDRYVHNEITQTHTSHDALTQSVGRSHRRRKTRL